MMSGGGRTAKMAGQTELCEEEPEGKDEVLLR